MATEVLVKRDVSGNPGILAATAQPATGIHDVVAPLNYYDDPGDGTPPTPVYIGGNTVTNERAMLQRQVTVSDISGREGDFTLDNCGFQLHHYPSQTPCAADGYHDLDLIKATYFPECEQILKDVTGASRIFIFDHKVRRGPSNWHKLGQNNSSKRGPLHRVHVDQSYNGAEFLVNWYLPSEGANLLKCHWQIINLWRPIKTIFKDPLAIADAQSVGEDDLVAAKVIYADHQRETWTVKPNPSHRWFFKYAQTPDEVMLIKCFDTDTSVARRSPHSAFQDAAHDDGDPRESIEIRALVFYSD